MDESDDDNAGLDEDELEILKDAGIIARPSKTRKRRSSRYQAKHVVFVENEEEGMHGKFDYLSRTISCVAARQYATNENAHAVSLSRSKSSDITSASDLGWQKPEGKRRERKKCTSATAVDTADTAASERSEVAKVRFPFLSV